jgi:hypothetical protein
MESPDIHVLKEVGWQFFGTLTFKQERLPERIRLSMWFKLVRKLARDHRVKFHKLLWCLRQEHGEATGRRHFHFLLAGLPVGGVHKQTCHVLRNTWESRCKGGMARVTVFDPRLDAGSYLTKPDGMADPGDAYESAKFGSGASSLMTAEAVWRFVAAKRQAQLMR